MTYIPEDVRADIIAEMAYDRAVDAALEQGLCFNLDGEVAISDSLCFNCQPDAEPMPEPPPLDGYEYL